VAGYVPRWFTCPQTLIHLNTNLAHRRATSLFEHITLLLRHATNNAMQTTNLMTLMLLVRRWSSSFARSSNSSNALWHSCDFLASFSNDANSYRILEMLKVGTQLKAK